MPLGLYCFPTLRGQDWLLPALELLHGGVISLFLELLGRDLGLKALGAGAGGTRTRDCTQDKWGPLQSFALAAWLRRKLPSVSSPPPLQ